MGKNIVQKIFEAHKVYGELTPGAQIGLKVDQVLTQDATGTMTWLEFEAIGIGRVQVETAVSYVDHNMLQSNFMNADDHQFLRTAAAKFGAWFSKPGNGICHQVHLERFAAPGKIALGTDSHTPTGGGMGMIAIGVGGLEAATVMAGAPLRNFDAEGREDQPHRRSQKTAYHRNGRHSDASQDADRQGRRGQNFRIRRSGRGKPHCYRARDDHQHGR